MSALYCNTNFKRSCATARTEKQLVFPRFFAVPYNINGYEWLKLEKEAMETPSSFIETHVDACSWLGCKNQ